MLFPVVLILKDAYGRSTRRSFLFDDIDLSTAKVNVGLWVTAYQNVTKLQVVESRLTDVQTYAGAPEATANVDEGATFKAQLDTPNKYASVRIVGVIDEARGPNGVIDMANANISAWAAFYASGLVTASDGETVSAIESGVLDK